mmetsp:Transcript_85381/g.174119  ORF Transcript_85381/g.174119 Transcript_85381/m.174119 type:complete len:93 (-) Transcript_85381:106-384(-)
MDENWASSGPVLPEEVEVGCGPGDLLRSGWSLPEAEPVEKREGWFLGMMRTMAAMILCGLVLIDFGMLLQALPCGDQDSVPEILVLFIQELR